MIFWIFKNTLFFSTLFFNQAIGSEINSVPTGVHKAKSPVLGETTPPPNKFSKTTYRYKCSFQYRLS